MNFFIAQNDYEISVLDKINDEKAHVYIDNYLLSLSKTNPEIASRVSKNTHSADSFNLDSKAVSDLHDRLLIASGWGNLTINYKRSYALHRPNADSNWIAGQSADAIQKRRLAMNDTGNWKNSVPIKPIPKLYDSYNPKLINEHNKYYQVLVTGRFVSLTGIYPKYDFGKPTGEFFQQFHKAKYFDVLPYLFGYVHYKPSSTMAEFTFNLKHQTFIKTSTYYSGNGTDCRLEEKANDPWGKMQNITLKPEYGIEGNVFTETEEFPLGTNQTVV